MILYLLSRDDLSIKAVKTLAAHEFKEDIDFANSSSVTIADYVQMEDGDFALIKDGSEQVFFGICKEMKPSDNGYKITLKQKETLFDTTIYKSGEELIQSSGLEDYIVKAIEDNFTDSGDALMDMDYIHVSASTHTKIAAKVSTIVNADNGVFNLKTFLGNVRQNYGIFLDFFVEKGAIRIDVNCREQTMLNVDTKLAEVADVSETYSVDVLAKLVVYWDTPKEYATVESVNQIEEDVNETGDLLNKNKLAYAYNNAGYQTLGEFVKATTESCHGMCGVIRFKDVYNIFGFNANTWLRVLFMYQNLYTSTYGVEGMLIVSRGKTAQVAFVSGNETNDVTLEWGSFS